MESSNHDQFFNEKATPFDSSSIGNTPSTAANDDNNSSTSNPLEQQDQTYFFSKEKGRMDYVSLKGIMNRTGAEQNDFAQFSLREITDNAADFQERGISYKKNNKMDIPPQIKVFITKESEYIRFRILNSNFGGIEFTEDKIKSIFNFDNFYSSKRNQYKISRGNLGDALKEILCIPFALADHYDIKKWNEALIISNGNMRFRIYLIVDKINQKISSDIKVEQIKTENDSSDFTEVEFHFPIIEGINFLHGIRWFLMQYAILNTHISFNFNLYGSEHIDSNLPQTQKLITDWSNPISIFYYTYPEFRNFIFGLEDNDISAYDIIRKNFREGTNIKKENVEGTIGDLKNNEENIRKLFDVFICFLIMMMTAICLKK